MYAIRSYYGTIGRLYFVANAKSRSSCAGTKKSSLRGMGYRDIYQAGKSVQGIHAIQPAAEIVAEFAAALEEAR